MTEVPIRQFYQECKKRLKLKLLTGQEGFDKLITQQEIHRPGLALSGFVDIFTYERIQVLGNTEMAYLRSISDEERKRAIKRVMDFEIPCLIVTNNNNIPDELLSLSRARKIALFKTPLSTTELVRFLSDYLDQKFAPSTTIHGTLVDVYGIGVLLTGRSGIGKSEIALDLVERGHRLVADDVVTITSRANEVLIGTGNEVVRHHLEIRGLGIVDVGSIFGIRAIRLQKRIEVEVQLEDWDNSEDYERLGLQENYTKILDVEIPLVRLPIFPGKNISVIVETIALNQILKIFGIHTAEEFNARLLERIKKKKIAKEYLEHDFE
ncbi:HPr kinase/phosphorylase [candidate division KSB1 bacterium]|nr:HPr kinase/phosphorylase [bacterium]RKY76421.1 MAG: HPr kinase/phosphorylase [candidate division KSB1 bacterium]RKY76547.1 MAG: HPr kinase/phosphorylase [candidate division KSB1 bacterium]RKY86811.1 MAG: HPr kinase/phosphorylase [candidate division KSB1 bacterium]